MWPIITTEQTTAAAAATHTHTHTQSTDDNNSSRSISSSSSSFSRRLMKTPTEEADEKAAGERPTDHHKQEQCHARERQQSVPFSCLRCHHCRRRSRRLSVAIYRCPHYRRIVQKGSPPAHTHTHTHTLLLFHCFFIIVIRFITGARGEGVLEVLWFCFIILALN